MCDGAVKVAAVVACGCGCLSDSKIRKGVIAVQKKGRIGVWLRFKI